MNSSLFYNDILKNNRISINNNLNLHFPPIKNVEDFFKIEEKQDHLNTSKDHNNTQSKNTITLDDGNYYKTPEQNRHNNKRRGTSINSTTNNSQSKNQLNMSQNNGHQRSISENRNQSFDNKFYNNNNNEKYKYQANLFSKIKNMINTKGGGSNILMDPKEKIN